MKVKRLNLNSFRGFDQLTLEFNPELPTVIIGNNGMGKSSMLDCIAILLCYFIDWIKFPTAEAQSIARRKHKKVFTAFLTEQDIKEKAEATDNELAIDLEDLQDIKLDIFRARKGYVEPRDIQERKRKINKLQTAAEKLHNQWWSNPKFNMPLAVYYPVNRAVFDILLEILDKSNFNQMEAYDEALTGMMRIGFSSFFQWFRLLEDLENEERRDDTDYRDQNLEAVRKAIYSLIPEFSKLRVRRSPLRMTVEKEGQELTINQLSDGEKCLLAMVGDLARRLAIANPGLENPLQGQGVVLIDEIELHLHPKWQREIIPALTRTFPNCQFIVTTHSPQVLSQVQPEGIFILEKEDDRIVAKKAESSYGRDSNRILEDLMGVPKRPQEIKEDFHKLFLAIEDKDLSQARQLCEQIADKIGTDDPELVKARTSIRRREILGK